MPKINDTTTFPNTTPALDDHVIGTDVSDTTNSADGETVTFTFSDIGDLIGGGGASYRNILYNGNMEVAQRSTSVTGITSGNYYTCDRWIFGLTSLGTWTMTQESDGPDGFGKSVKLLCTTADAIPSPSSLINFRQQLEGRDLQRLKKGTSGAASLTVSFWVKSNVTGTYQVNLQDLDNTRIIGATYTIDSADTWEEKEVTFAGDTTGALDDDTSASLRLEFWMAGGSNYTGGAVPTSWETKADTDRFAGGDVNLADTVNNYWQCTGVQLEVSAAKTDFEHIPLTLNRLLCWRYFWRINGNGSTLTPIGSSHVFDSNTVQTYIQTPVTMRAAPTVTASNGLSVLMGGTATNVDFSSSPLVEPNGFIISTDADSGTPFTTGQGGYLRIAASASDYIEADAEI